MIPMTQAMIKHPVALIIFLALLFPASNGASVPVRNRTVTFEGTLLSYSPHPNLACGVLYIHQVAKYRIERVLDGKYSSGEIVVDHPACRGDVFKDIPLGSRVRLKVRVLRKYGVLTMHPGIRENERPQIFYLAMTLPEKVSN